MASPRVMASSAAAAGGSDVAGRPSAYPAAVGDQTEAHGVMRTGALIREFYGRQPAFAAGEAPTTLPLPPPLPRGAEYAWEEISGGAGSGYEDAAAAAECAEVTLEDFLARTGTVREEDVGLPVAEPVQAGLLVDQATLALDNPMLRFGNRVVNGGGRVRKRTVLDDPVDKVAMRRQKRMIKNRESAARSRERKQVYDLILPFSPNFGRVTCCCSLILYFQAYTVELESLVAQLEEENAMLLSEQVFSFLPISHVTFSFVSLLFPFAINFDMQLILQFLLEYIYHVVLFFGNFFVLPRSDLMAQEQWVFGK
ncbi:hypothetical protein Cni_G06045 [Canna indica]|uniref:BZIP domain-containing protein n=1 Tax=Canna indica TaxID=4628 RepID=A0AAQ3JYG5_9LILI|nr:hypothetical protein Cni_G06045 [Canna indica]